VQKRILSLFDTGGTVAAEGPHDGRVQVPAVVHALITGLVVLLGDVLGVGHRFTRDLDRPALLGEALAVLAAVQRVLADRVRLKPLDPGGLEHQGAEQDHGEDGEAPDGCVHRRITCVAPSSWIALGAGRRALSLMRSSRPIISQLAMSAEPPAARNGVVIPVRGMMRSRPPSTTNSWKHMTKARPLASILMNSSREASAMRMPRCTSRKTTTRIAMRPVRPSSSASDAMMKSLSAAKMLWASPPPIPVPNRPP